MHNSEMKQETGQIDTGVLLKGVIVEVRTQVPSEKDGEDPFLVPYRITFNALVAMLYHSSQSPGWP